MAYKIVFVCIFFTLFVRQTFYELTLFQQQHYDYNKYVKSCKEYYLFTPSTLFGYLIFLMTLSTYFKAEWFLIFSMPFVLWAFFIINKPVIPLKFTKRAIRLVFTIVVLMCYIALLGLKRIGVPLFTMLYLMIPFIIILARFINEPIEWMIRKRFLKAAKIKLSKNKGLFKIAITGSYGKTSTKNILKQLLDSDYLVLATPHSYNTPLGIARTINEHLYQNTEIFIAEMGAFRPGEIEYLTNLLEPTIGILTAIGPQHLSTFKTLDRIIKTKMELLESQNGPRCLVVNADDENISNYLKTNSYKGTVVGVGIKNEKAKYLASNLRTNKNKTLFSFYQEGEYLFDVATALLGRHNIYNILLGMATIFEMDQFGLDIKKTKLPQLVGKVKPTTHRLEYQERGKWIVLDDSYNANVTGYIYALEVLAGYNGLKIVITPGLVDGGKATKGQNETIAKRLMDVADEVFLIDNMASRFIRKVFEEGAYPCTVFKSFKAASQAVTEKFFDQPITLLIENDLPDSFLRRKK